MASIQKRRNSYLLVVSMGYEHNGKRRAAQQKTVRPQEGLTPKQREKWLNEQAVLFEKECKDTPLTVNKAITLAEYVKIWLRDIAPDKLAKSTLAHDKQDIDRFLPYLGSYKLTELRPERFRKLYTELRQQKSQNTGMPLSEYTVEGVHACLCGILSDAIQYLRMALQANSEKEWASERPFSPPPISQAHDIKYFLCKSKIPNYQWK